MFDDFLRDWYARHDRAVRGVRPPTDYDEYVDGKPRAGRGARPSSRRAGSTCPRARRTTRRGRDGARLGTRKNELVLELIREHGVEVVEGSVRFVRGGARAGLRRAVVSSSTNCQDVLVAAGIERPLRGPHRRHRRRARGAARASPRPDTFLAGAKALGAEPSAGRRLRGRARGRRGGPRRGLRLGGRRRPQRPGRGAAAPRRRRRRAGPRRAAGGAMIGQDVFAVEPWSIRRARAATSTCSARRSRSSRCPTATSGCAATSTRASRTARPGTYLNALLRGPAAAVRRGRLRLPRGRADADQRHERQAHPPAGRRRAVRRPLRRAACATSGCWTCATACCAARWSGSRPRARPCGSARRGSCRSSSARSRRSRYEVEPVDGARAHRRPVGARGQRAGARSESDDPRAAAALRAPLRRRAPRPQRAARRPRSTGRGRAGCAWRRRMDHVVDGPEGTVDRRPRASPTSRGSRSATELRARPDAAGRQAGRLRVVEPALAALAARPGRRRAHGGGAHGLGRAVPRAAGVPRRRSGSARTWSSTAMPSCSRRVRFALFHVVQAGARAEQRRDPGQGADRPRLRRPHVLGHGDVHAARC